MLAKTPGRGLPDPAEGPPKGWPEAKWLLASGVIVVCCLFSRSFLLGLVGGGTAIILTAAWAMIRLVRDLEQFDMEQHPGLAEHIMRFDGAEQRRAFEAAARALNAQ